MKCRVLHESPGRMRVHFEQARMTLRQADMLEYYLNNHPSVLEAKIYPRTGDAIIRYIQPDREIVRKALSEFNYDSKKAKELVPDHTGRELNQSYEDRLVMTVVRRVGWNLFVPACIRAVWTAVKSLKYLGKGINVLRKGKIEVPVLDATAISVAILRCDFKTASTIMFMLSIGEILEDWTHKKSVDDLARTMALNVDRVWRVTEDQEELVPVTDVEIGDMVVVRRSNVIPLDGTVVSGEATVNQASMTGESLPVLKNEGSYVYAGTVVEEGECTIRVAKNSGSGRYDRIVHMIEESEKLKSATEDRASHLADKLVPYSLGATALTYLLTRNATKALSILMVDFSCALKLAMPISVLSAMRESSYYQVSVKGGRFMEEISEADTIVFDKTGTLTHACPTVADVVVFGGNDRDEMLRTAACLEEHYPHSMANAVVDEAKRRALRHEEYHSKVEYVVAHGISSTLEGKKVVIGSRHFVFEDEKCVIPAGEEDKFESLPDEYSHLYLAVSGVLAAVICVQDPIREEASAVITSLHRLGISKVVMMTGDNEKTAAAVAAKVGVDEFHAGVLPEDKASFIRAEREAGRKVIMIGDGVNDSPALSEADVGIAISDGAAIAREIADITVASDDLFALVTMKQISDALMARINWNYRAIISFNLGLILLGVGGFLQPATSAVLHNMSTLAIGMKSMTNLIA